jgi:hypothetical protein
VWDWDWNCCKHNICVSVDALNKIDNSDLYHKDVYM